MDQPLDPAATGRVLGAYAVLFQVAAPRGGCTLDRGGLRKAFRAAALETHPDRAAHLGLPPDELTARFQKVKHAYDYLCSVLGPRERLLIEAAAPPATTAAPAWSWARAPRGEQREHRQREAQARPAGPAREQREHRQHRTQARAAGPAGEQRSGPAAPVDPGRSGPDSTRSSTGGLFWGARLPGRRLLLGQYLFYASAISLRQLTEAVAWQRAQRPLVGEIARRWGILSPLEVLEVLRHAAGREPFCEAAVREGKMTPFHQLAVLGRQRQLQRPLGTYFVREGILGARELEQLVVAARRHNGAFGAD